MSVDTNYVLHGALNIELAFKGHWIRRLAWVILWDGVKYVYIYIAYMYIYIFNTYDRIHTSDRGSTVNAPGSAAKEGC